MFCVINTSCGISAIADVSGISNLLVIGIVFDKRWSLGEFKGEETLTVKCLKLEFGPIDNLNVFTIQSRWVCAQQEHRVGGGRRKEANSYCGEAATGRPKSILLERPVSNPALRRGQSSTILSKGQPHCPRMKAGNTRSYATVYMQRTLSLLAMSWP